MSDLDLMSDTATALMWATGAALWLGLVIRYAYRRHVARHRRATYQPQHPRNVRVRVGIGK